MLTKRSTHCPHLPQEGNYPDLVAQHDKIRNSFDEGAFKGSLWDLYNEPWYARYKTFTVVTRHAQHLLFAAVVAQSIVPQNKFVPKGIYLIASVATALFITMYFLFETCAVDPLEARELNDLTKKQGKNICDSCIHVQHWIAKRETDESTRTAGATAVATFYSTGGALLFYSANFTDSLLLQTIARVAGGALFIGFATYTHFKAIPRINSRIAKAASECEKTINVQAEKIFQPNSGS